MAFNPTCHNLPATGVIAVLSYCVRLIPNVYVDNPGVPAGAPGRRLPASGARGAEYRPACLPARLDATPSGGGGEKTGAPTGAPIRTGVSAILALTEYPQTGAPTGAPGRRTELRRGRKTGTPTGVPVYFHAAPRSAAFRLRADATARRDRRRRRREETENVTVSFVVKV